METFHIDNVVSNDHRSKLLCEFNYSSHVAKCYQYVVRVCIYSYYLHKTQSHKCHCVC